MAKTKISDVIVPEVFNPYVIERTAELSAFFQSGVIATNPELNRLASLGGTLINMPFWEDLSGDSQILSDSKALEVNNISANKDVARLHARGNAWSVNDLAKALSGDDPLRAIGDLVASYWAREWQKMLIKTLEGAMGTATMADNVHDISSEGSAATRTISASTTLDAIQKMGDAKDKLQAFAMHSATETLLAKNDLIDYVPESQSGVRIPFYLGKRVIVDDGLPVTSGTYTTYLFGAGAIGLGEGSAPVPTEMDRDSLAGDDILINRRHFLLHPRGIKWLEASVDAVVPTNDEIATTTNWQRVYENKNIRIVQFKHKLA